MINLMTNWCSNMFLVIFEFRKCSQDELKTIENWCDSVFEKYKNLYLHN